MKKAAIFLVMFLILFYAFQGYYPEFMYFFSNAFPIFISGVALFSAFSALRRYYNKFGSRFSLIWMGIFVGVLFWFLGEVSWGICALSSSNEIPYPSIADVFWIIGYLCILSGLLLYAETFIKIVPSARIIGVTIMAIVYAISIIATFMPIIAFEEDLVKLTLDLTYPILDVLLIYSSTLGMVIFFKGRIWRAWLTLCSAFICYAVADVLFGYVTIIGAYHYGSPIELLFHVGYILLALAFYEHRKEL